MSTNRHGKLHPWNGCIFQWRQTSVHLLHALVSCVLSPATSRVIVDCVDQVSCLSMKYIRYLHGRQRLVACQLWPSLIWWWAIPQMPSKLDIWGLLAIIVEVYVVAFVYATLDHEHYSGMSVSCYCQPTCQNKFKGCSSMRLSKWVRIWPASPFEAFWADTPSNLSCLWKRSWIHLCIFPG